MIPYLYCIFLVSFVVAEYAPASNTLNTLDDAYPRPTDLVWPVPADIDAVFQRANGKLYFFKDNQCWRVTDRLIINPKNARQNILDPGYPKTIAEEWDLWDVDHVDAVFQRPSDGKIYIFSGRFFWRYEDNYKNDLTIPLTNKPDVGFPQLIRDYFIGVPDSVDSAFYRIDGTMMFIKNQQLYAFRDKFLAALTDGVDPGVVYQASDIETAHLCYPLAVGEVFEEFPVQTIRNNINNRKSTSLAIFWRHSNRKLYVFSNSDYWRYTDKYVRVDPRPLGYFDGTAQFTDIIDCAFQRRNGQIFFFLADTFQICQDPFLYIVANVNDATSDDLLDCTDPFLTAEKFTGLPIYFDGFDTIFTGSNGFIYFIFGVNFYMVPDYYLDVLTGGPNPPGSPSGLIPLGAPTPLTQFGLPATVVEVNSAFQRANGKLYFFCKDVFYRCTMTSPNTATVDVGYPLEIASYFDPNLPVKAMYQRQASTNRIFWFSGVTGFFVMDDNNLILETDCTTPFPQCYSNDECPPSSPYCYLPGTHNALCSPCRTNDDCSHNPALPICDFQGQCRAADTSCEDNGDAYAIGGDRFVFFMQRSAVACCGNATLGNFYEGSIYSPTWMTFGKYRQLEDPIHLGRMGLRRFDNEGMWDALGDMGFAFSMATVDAYGKPYTIMSSRLADTCHREFPAAWLPVNISIWEGAKPISGPSDLNINRLFYWDGFDSTGTIGIRVYWECIVDSTTCVRKITLTNLHPTLALGNLNFLHSFNFDVTPTPGKENLKMWMYDTSGSSPITMVPEPTLSGNLLDPFGLIRPLAYTDIGPASSACYSSSNTNIDWLPAGSVLCDAGGTFQSFVGVLPVGNSIDFVTRVQVFDTMADFDNAVNAGVNHDLFYVASAGLQLPGSDPSVAAAFVEPWRGPYPTNADPTDRVPGNCPCVHGTCNPNVLELPCICDRSSWGTYCENTCGPHGAWNGGGIGDPPCLCDYGYFGTTNCDNVCQCSTLDKVRGSWCDQQTGTCYCKNGYYGNLCLTKLSCPKI